MKRLMLSFLAVLLAAGAAFAQMGGGHMGGGHMSGGSGYGMHGAGGMSSMMGSTMSHGYLDLLDPLSTSNDARTAIAERPRLVSFNLSNNSPQNISKRR